jgi:hypothetical protein
LKKTFFLKDEKKDLNRILDSIKHNIRKYIKREKRKTLPEGSDFWKINCKFGQNEQNAIDIRFEDIIKTINALPQENWESFYIELTSEASNINYKIKELAKEDGIPSEINDENTLEDDIKVANEN